MSKLKKVKKSGDGWIACCPSHDDETPSLKISLGNDGKILFHCKAGCSINQICNALGIAVKDLFPTKVVPTEKHILTIEELAQAKALPVDFLQNLGVSQDDRGVIIPYYDTDRKPQKQRKRIHVVAKQGSLWEGTGKIIPYGLWKLEEAKQVKYLILVEGESDSWTLWYHGYPALGIPSADMTKKLEASHLENITKIYISDERDQGAKIFVPGIKERLEKFQWQGEVYTITMSEGLKDPNDLHRQNPQTFKETFQKILENATPLGNASQTTEPEKKPLKPFPIEVFPPEIAQYCKELSESLGVPIDYAGCSILTVAGILSGNKKEIEIKSDWQERPAIDMAIVGATGSGKSPTINKTMSTIFEIEKELQEQNNREEEKYENALLDYENALTLWKTQAKKGTPPGTKPQKPERPKPKTIFSSDTTVEAIAEMLGNNERGILLYRDELTAWITSLNQYKGGKGNDKEFFLSAWSGIPAKVDRKGKKAIYIPRPFLCILGGIMPENLNILKGKVHDGFIERILFSFPEPMKAIWSDTTVSPDTKEKTKAILRKLHEDTHQDTIELTKDAREIFAIYYEYLKDIKETDIPGILAKLPAYTARFALILTLLHGKRVCDIEIMDKAIEIANYFRSHAEKIFQELETSKEQKETHAIVEWAKRKGIRKIKTRDLCRACIPGCKNAREAKAKMQELVDLDSAKWVFFGKEIELVG